MTIEGATILPDGSAFFTASLPLPADHWLYEQAADGFPEPPPMPLRLGEGVERSVLAELVRQAARYAVRASTWCGAVADFDPDAMVKNFVVGLLGYWTADGTLAEAWGNPDPIPPLYKG